MSGIACCAAGLLALTRCLALEGGPAGGLTAMFKTQRLPEGDVVGDLEAAGFRPARLLAEREGYRFAEGIKT